MSPHGTGGRVMNHVTVGTTRPRALVTQADGFTLIESMVALVVLHRGYRDDRDVRVGATGSSAWGVDDDGVSLGGIEGGGEA